jgi:cytochrome c553
MKLPVKIVLAFLACLEAPAFAASAVNGNSLYHSYCVGCHGDPPRGGPEKAADSPATISNALNTVGAMQFLRGQLTDAEIADIAAYIGSLASSAPPPGPPIPEFDYTDMWWSSAESGWGLNVIQHASNVIFGVIFTYEAPNRPTWFVLPGGTWTSSTTYTGTLYRVAGTPANMAFLPVNATVVGTATLLFSSSSSATITYSVDGAQVTKSLARQSF